MMKLKENFKEINRYSCLLYLLIIVVFTASSCKKYLDIKSDKKLTVPSTLEDCEALLSPSDVMNWSYGTQGEVSSDNFYLTTNSWKNLPLIARNNYSWKSDADIQVGVWDKAYERVLYANQVLETLNKISTNSSNQTRWNTIKGRALFFRAYSFYSVAQLFAKSYNLNTTNLDPGIPIRLTPDITEVTMRGTVQQTYDRIIQDLKESKELLPEILPISVLNKTVQPVKTTAMAALARIYLDMEDYNNAAINSNECLQRYNNLINYNQLNASSPFPIPVLNSEVIFQAQGIPTSMFNLGIVDNDLYQSYNTNDLRKNLYFSNKGDGNYGFKGNYNGTTILRPFMGIATDEIYLIRAECYARMGNTSNAMSDLNKLLKNRWSDSSPYIDITAENQEDALNKILIERRKELLFRGTRWTDLRRLNKDSRFAKTLSRTIDNQTFQLPPNDLRYVLLIPLDVLKNVNIAQNPR